MKLTIDVAVLAPDGSESENFQVVARAPDIIRWEKVHAQGWYGSDSSLEQASEVAYYAARRTGKFSGTLENWLAVVDIDNRTDEEEEEPRPTQPSPGDDS
jgi:hypothetical protein